MDAECVGWVEAVKADTHRDECMMGIATLNPSYTCSAHLGVLSVHCVKGLLKIASLDPDGTSQCFINSAAFVSGMV